ncbi:unnamed protein product [Protopolystoma xenopodis]|uniref:Secreted protein n=1 Tax=Protopolystoma xenopodis TaxID=117903 RepID=A0A3S5B1X5_9PLAT|nr:unnamed protein product [Protopolystoma xenopodis]
MPLLLAHALSAVTNFSMLLSIATFTPIDSDSYTLLTPGNCTTGFRLTDKLQSGTLLVSFGRINRFVIR